MTTQRNYDVYFEIYGKKLKAVVMAESEQKAKEIIQAKIIFHKVQPSKDCFNEVMDMMDDVINFLDSKR